MWLPTIPLADARNMIWQARKQIDRSQGTAAYQHVRTAALTIQHAAHNGGVSPEMVRHLREAIGKLPQ